jgi:hypothetical protein
MGCALSVFCGLVAFWRSTGCTCSFPATPPTDAIRRVAANVRRGTYSNCSPDGLDRCLAGRGVLRNAVEARIEGWCLEHCQTPSVLLPQPFALSGQRVQLKPYRDRLQLARPRMVGIRGQPRGEGSADRARLSRPRLQEGRLPHRPGQHAIAAGTRAAWRSVRRLGPSRLATARRHLARQRVLLDPRQRMDAAAEEISRLTITGISALPAGAVFRGTRWRAACRVHPRSRTGWPHG